MQKYIIVQGESMAETEKKVNEKIEIGYKPIGNVSTINFGGSHRVDYHQAMIYIEKTNIL